MITLEQYFGKFEYIEINRENAKVLLSRVNVLLEDAKKYGVVFGNKIISGEQYGGFRPQSCPIGAANSAHKLGMAVDIYDPNNALDGWLDDIKLLKYDLYREHPDYTKGWCHLSTKPPRSGKRTFLP